MYARPLSQVSRQWQRKGPCHGRLLRSGSKPFIIGRTPPLSNKPSIFGFRVSTFVCEVRNRQDCLSVLAYVCSQCRLSERSTCTDFCVRSSIICTCNPCRSTRLKHTYDPNLYHPCYIDCFTGRFYDPSTICLYGSRVTIIFMIDKWSLLTIVYTTIVELYCCNVNHLQSNDGL